MKAVKVIVILLVLTGVIAVTGCKGAYEGALADAVRTEDIADANKYVKKGADINAQWFGRTPIQLAAEESSIKMIKFLLKNGADINAESKFEKTALDYAEAKKRSDIVIFLKKRGAKRAVDIKK